LAAGWLLRCIARRRWRAWLALALIVGAFAGTVEAAAAGARRTDSAYPSLLAWSKPPDVLLFSGPGQSATFGQLSPAAAVRLPQVAQSAVAAGYNVVAPAVAYLLAPENDAVPGSFWHRKILAGRLPDPARAGEVDISFTLAQASHLGVGDLLRIGLLTTAGQTERFNFRIVGIDAAPAEFPPQTGTGTDFVWATPAFYRRHRLGLQVSSDVALRLRRGTADLAAVQREISRLDHGKVAQSYPLATQAENTEHSIHLQAVALWLLGAVLGVISLLVIGQLLVRLNFLEASDHDTLRALGVSRGALLAVGLGRAAAIGTAGATAGTLLAVALSPVLPVGLAGIAEPHPGMHADGAVLGLGAAAAVLATVACAAWPAWRAASAGSRRARRAVAARTRGLQLATLATSGIGWVSAAIGVRLALQPGAGRTALPVRSTIASAMVGVAALTAAIVFSASLGNLLATPALYGVTWSAYVSNSQSTGIGQAASSIGSDSGVTAWSAGYSAIPMSISGVRADGIAMLPGHGGSLLPVPIRGHLPTGAGQIALGEHTLAAIHARIGATVEVSLAGFRPGRLKIVGTAVFPTLSDALGLGQGVTLTVSGLRTLLPRGLPAPPLDTLLVRFRPSADPQARVNALAVREARLGPYVVQGPATPTDLVNFGRVQDLPLLLGVALSLLALLTIVHLLLTSVRRRHRDFAVLRSLGFTRRQVRSAVRWQAGTLTAAALLLGIPVGIGCGRLAWRAFAGQLGILPVADVPLAALAVLVPAALALAVAVAAVPGESAARTRPTEILRSE
jgi:ABC-type lipoprotein release transport system permease subunit